MQIIMLGTGHGKAINCYNCCFLIKTTNTNLLVDSGGGNGIIHQLRKGNIEIENIDNIFISHKHIDHILGLIWIIRVLCPKYYNNTINKKINIYGNIEVTQTIKKLINILIPNDFISMINKYFMIKTIYDGESILFDDGKIDFFDIKAKKILEYGFLLKENNIKFMFLGDESFNIKNEKYIMDCNYMFADARNSEINYYNNCNRHSTIEFSAKIANKYGVKNLILSHTIDDNLDERKENFINIAKKYYNGRIFVPNDLEIITMEDN